MNAGRNAIITGGMRDIGLHIGKALLRTKLEKLCMIDLNEDKITINEMRKQYPRNTIIYERCDVTEREQLDNMFKGTLKKFGQLDIVINNAGIFNDLASELTLKTGLCGVINSSLLAMQYMSQELNGRGGYIINIASTAGLGPVFFAPIYTSAKWGVIGFTRSMGYNDFYDNKTGVKFMAVCPGRTQTKIGDHLLDGLFMKDLKKIVESQFMAKTSEQHANIIGDCVLEALNTDKNGSIFVCDNDFIKEVELTELAQEFVLKRF